MTKDFVQQELSQYRAVRCLMEQLRLDIEAYKEELLKRPGEQIQGEALAPLRELGLPRGGFPQDRTGRLGAALSCEEEIARLRAERRALARRLQRMDAWLEALPYRQRQVVTMVYVQGMVWSEVVASYNATAADGIAKEECTVRRWKRQGIEHIAGLAGEEEG